MADELPQRECESARQLYTNFLETSKDHAKAYLITDLWPNIIDFDIDTSVLKSDQWYELMDEITKLNGISEQVASNALDQIEFVSDGRIFSDIEVISLVRSKSADFENSTSLSKACLLAQKAQQLTDEYVEEARKRYAQFIDTVLPKFENIKEALNKLKVDAAGTDTADWNVQVVAITQILRSIIQRMQETKDEQTSNLKIDIEKMAMHVDSGYQEICQELVAINSPQVLPPVELTTPNCGSAQQLHENLSKASMDHENVGVINDLLPQEIVIDIHPDVGNAQWDELLKTTEELNEMRKQLVYSGLETMKNLTIEIVTNDVDAVRFVGAHLTDFENSTLLAAACLLAEKEQKLTDEYANNVRVRYTQFIEDALPKLDASSDAFKKLTNASADASDLDWHTQVHETIQILRSNIQRMKENEKWLLIGLLDDVEDMALQADAGYEVILNDLYALCQN